MEGLYSLIYNDNDYMNSQLRRYTELYTNKEGPFSGCYFPWPPPKPINEDEMDLFEMIPSGTKYIVGYTFGDNISKQYVLAHAYTYLNIL